MSIPGLTKEGPNYEKNISNNMLAYNILMTFPTCPVPSEQTIIFPAYVKSVTDTFTPTYSSKEVYGRMDPIPVYSRTTRNIQFDLELPSYGLKHSREISEKLNILAKNIYPTYTTNGSVNIIASPPLVRIFFSNFISDSPKRLSEDGKAPIMPILGYFSNGITIKHDLEGNGIFIRRSGFEAYAKSYSLSFSINVLHRYTPGYINGAGGIKNQINILKGI